MISLPLILAIAIVAPQDGATVPLLRPAQKDFLLQSQKERFRRLDDAPYRHKLVRSGHTQPPVKLAWTNAAEAVTTLLLESAGKAGGEVVRQSFALTNLTQAYITNLELGRTYRWTVRSGGEEASGCFVTESQPPRLLRIEGVVNARDLGGWVGMNGRKVRSNMILRSGGFRGSASNKDKSIFSSRFEAGAQDITEEGIAFLRDEVGIKTDIEVRGVMETVCMTDSVLGPNVRFVKEPFSAYNFIDNLIRGREPFARLFRTFERSESYPIVIHCAGGRDRTGTLAVLLLGLLGVSDEDIVRDWETSVFSEENTQFGSARIERLLDYLRSMGGDSFAEDCEIFAKSCGISDESIERFRAIMLEEGGAK